MIRPMNTKQIVDDFKMTSPNLLVKALALGYCVSVPFDPIAIFGGRTAPSIFGSLLVGVWLLEFVRSKRAVKIPQPFSWLIYGIVLWAAVTFLWAPVQATLLPLLSLILNVLICIVLIDTLWALPYRGLGALLIGATSMGIFLIISPSGELYDRVTVGAADENAVALQLTLGLAAAVCLLFASNGPAIYFVIAGSVCAYAALLTGSRTGAAAILAILILGSLISSAARRIARWKSILFLAAVTFLAYLALTYDMLPSRVSDFLAGNIGVRESGRESIEALYFQSIDNWWLRGVGFGSDAIYLSEESGRYLNAHGLFFKAWVELGGIGVVLVALVITVAFYYAYSRFPLKLYPVLFAPVLAFALTLFGLTSAAFWYVIAAGLTIGPDKPDR